MAINYFKTRRKVNGFEEAIKLCSEFDQKLYITDPSLEKDHCTSYKSKIIITPRLMNLKGPGKIVWWDPQGIYVIPGDNEFRRIHQSYISFIKDYFESSLVQMNEVWAAKQQYNRGELCFFRDYINRDLGPWLRGIVLKTPKISNWVRNSSYTNYRCSREELSGIMNKENFIYRILSIDYGFKVYKSPRNLRKVQDPKLFRSYVPWALRCSLYGLFPIVSDIESSNPGGFSTTCINMMEIWIRDKLLDYRGGSFYMIIRSNLRQTHFNVSTKVILFHKPSTNKSTKMEQDEVLGVGSLNAYLLDSGHATDTNPDSGLSSNIFLEQYLIDLLFTQQRQLEQEREQQQLEQQQQQQDQQQQKHQQNNVCGNGKGTAKK